MVLSKTASQSDVSVHATFTSRYVRTSLPPQVMRAILQSSPFSHSSSFRYFPCKCSSSTHVRYGRMDLDPGSRCRRNRSPRRQCTRSSTGNSLNWTIEQTRSREKRDMEEEEEEEEEEIDDDDDAMGAALSCHQHPVEIDDDDDAMGAALSCYQHPLLRLQRPLFPPPMLALWLPHHLHHQEGEERNQRRHMPP